jgi:hypothetical protein
VSARGARPGEAGEGVLAAEARKAAERARDRQVLTEAEEAEAAVDRARRTLRGRWGAPAVVAGALEVTRVDAGTGTVELSDGTAVLQVAPAGVVYLLSPLPPGAPAGGLRVETIVALGQALEQVG